VKMTSEIQAEICKYLALGMPRDSAAALVGINVETFYDHQRRFPDFSEQVDQAEAKCQARCLTVINRSGMPKIQIRDRTKTHVVPVRNSKGKVVTKAEALEKVNERVEKQESNWEAAAWLLERRWPQIFGRVDRHLLHITPRSGPLPQDYIDAVSNALGIGGKLVPIGMLPAPGENEEPPDVLDVLPQD